MVKNYLIFVFFIIDGGNSFIYLRCILGDGKLLKFENKRVVDCEVFGVFKKMKRVY